MRPLLLFLLLLAEPVAVNSNLNPCFKGNPLMGNPCQAHWESGWKDYVVGTLPQLERLDGVEITRTERIKALQRLPDLERELALLAPLAQQRKRDQKLRWAERQRKIESGELVVDNETTSEYCPEIRVEDARELREIEEDKAEYRKKAQREGDLFFRDQQRERTRFYKDDGTPIQMNTAKWPFSIEEDGLNVYVDVALPRFLDSNAVRVRKRRGSASSLPCSLPALACLPFPPPLPTAKTPHPSPRREHNDDNTLLQLSLSERTVLMQSKTSIYPNESTREPREMAVMSVVWRAKRPREREATTPCAAPVLLSCPPPCLSFSSSTSSSLLMCVRP